MTVLKFMKYTVQPSQTQIIIPANKTEENLLHFVETGLIRCDKCGFDLNAQLTMCPICNTSNVVTVSRGE